MSDDGLQDYDHTEQQRFEEEHGLPRPIKRIALFRLGGQSGVEMSGEQGGYTDTCGTNTRVSEWVDVHFPLRAKDEVLRSEIAALDTERAEVATRFQRLLEDIADRKAKLLSLTQEVLQ